MPGVMALGCRKHCLKYIPKSSKKVLASGSPPPFGNATILGTFGPATHPLTLMAGKGRRKCGKEGFPFNNIFLSLKGDYLPDDQGGIILV